MSDPLLSNLFADAVQLSAPSSPSVACGPPQGPSRSGGFLDVSPSQQAKLVSSKQFSVAKIDCSDARLCFGRIGVGSAFCFRRDCNIKSHIEIKMPFAGSSDVIIIICQSVGISAFVEPSVNESQIPTTVWTEWRDKTLTLAEWRREFQVVSTMNNQFASSDDIKEETKFLATADDFRTPGKRKRDAAYDEPQLVGDLKSLRYERVLPVDPTELEKVVAFGMKRGYLTSIVAGLETNVIVMGEGIEEVAIMSASQFQANEATMDVVVGQVQNVRAGLGTPVELDNPFVAPTMWGTVSLLADEVMKVGESLKDTIDQIRPQKDHVVAALGTIKEESSTTVKILSMVMKAIKTLSSDGAKIQELMSVLQKKVEREVATHHNKAATSGSHESVDELMSRLMNQLLTPEGKTEVRRSSRRSPSPLTAVEDLSASHPILTAENYRAFRQVIEDVSVLKISAEATAIKFGNLGLRNLQECSRWVVENFSEARYGLVVDPLILLDRIFGNNEVDPMTQLKTLESRLKLNIETGAEASAITSLSHSRPRIFHSGRPMMTCDQNTSRLNKLCKHSKWKTGGEGVRKFIIKQMNVLQSSMASDITFAYGGYPEHAKAQMIASLSLTASVSFITQLLNYIDALFEKLHVYSKFTVETGWSLTMQVLDRITADLFAPKDGVANGMKGDQSSVCSHILWASFRTHDVAQAYLDFNFENHPAISSEFIKFLATNSGFEKVERLTEQADLNKAKLTAALAEVAIAKSKSDTASTKVSELLKELSAVTRRVKALEDKR